MQDSHAHDVAVALLNLHQRKPYNPFVRCFDEECNGVCKLSGGNGFGRYRYWCTKCGLMWSQERDVSKGITKRLSRHRTLYKITNEAAFNKRSPLPLITGRTIEDVTATTTVLCDEALIATQKAMQAMLVQQR